MTHYKIEPTHCIFWLPKMPPVYIKLRKNKKYPCCKTILSDDEPVRNGCAVCEEFISECKGCGKERHTVWLYSRHICGCKMLCTKCVVEHDEECENLKDILHARRNWKKNFYVC